MTTTSAVTSVTKWKTPNVYLLSRLLTISYAFKKKRKTNIRNDYVSSLIGTGSDTDEPFKVGRIATVGPPLFNGKNVKKKRG